MSQEDLLAKLFEQLLDADGNKNDKKEPDKSHDDGQDDIFGGIDIEAIMKLGEIMSSMNSGNDKNTQLLLALKPHLRQENRKKVDSALRLMKIINLLPLLKESGIIDGLF
ncbi:MAG: hypothetical protein NC394_05330 [Bacteroides sp.]|nr:hypothetical protein [Bacteroides sp.]